MANILDFILVIINEIRSYFVPEKITYEITGECKKCGKCCNYMYSKDTYTEKEFKIMQFLFPAYKRFYIKGKDVFQMQDIDSAFNYIPDETNDRVIYMKNPVPIPIGVKPVKKDLLYDKE